MQMNIQSAEEQTVFDAKVLVIDWVLFLFMHGLMRNHLAPGQFHTTFEWGCSLMMRRAQLINGILTIQRTEIRCDNLSNIL